MSEPTDLSRRRVLQLLAAAGVTGALATQAPPRRPTRPAARSTPTSPLVAPYQLQHSSQLSQDYFTTTEILVGADDEVHPFYLADGSAGAFVLIKGAASLVLPDPTQPSGYSYQAITLPQPVAPYTDDGPLTPSGLVAATDSSGRTFVMITYSFPSSVTPIPKGQASSLFVLAQLTDGKLTKIGEIDTLDYFDWVHDVAYPLPAVPAKATIGQTGQVIFYVFLDGQNYFTVSPPGQTAPTVAGMSQNINNIVDGFLLDYNGAWVIGVDDTTTPYYLGPNGFATTGPSLGPDGFLSGLGVIDSTHGPAVAAVGYGPDQSDPGSTIFVALLQDGKEYDLPLNATYPSLDTVLLVPNGNSWRIASVSQGVLQIATQFGPVGPTSYGISEAVPFQTGVLTAWAPAAAITTPTFFVVREDESLAVLTQSAADAAWTLTPIRQPSPTVQELTQWRTQLVLRDANGLPVANHDLHISADVDVAIWQNNTNTVLNAGDSQTFTTNDLGQLTFSTPALGLHTATLTVTGSDLTTTTVAPDADVHGYLAGTGSLTPIGSGSAAGMLTASSFASATVTTGSSGSTPGTTSALSPTLAALSASDRQSAATAVVTTITQAVGAGMTAQSGAPGATKKSTSFQLDLRSAAPVYSDSTMSGFTPLKFDLPDPFSFAGSIASDVWSDVDQIVGAGLDVAQAITFIAKQDAEGVTSYVVTIACAVVGGVKYAFNYVISDVRTALTAVTAILKTIGADLADVIAWLRALLDGLILEAWNLATELDGYIRAVPGHVNAYKSAIEGQVAAGVDFLRTTVDNEITTIQNALGVTPTTNPGGYAQAPVSLGPFSGSATEVLQAITGGVQSTWVFSKLVDDLDVITFDGTDAIQQDFTALADQIGSAVVSSLTQVSTQLATQFIPSGSDPTDIGAIQLGELVGLIRPFVDLGAELSDDFFDALLQLLVDVLTQAEAQLTASVSSDLGFIGKVLDYLGIDISLTLQKLLCLVIAFPAIALHDYASGSTAVAGTRGSAKPTDGPPSDLLLAAAFCMADGFSGIGGVAEDLYEQGGAEAPTYITVIGALGDLLGQALSWPGLANLSSTQVEPYENGPLDLRLPRYTYLYYWLASLVPLAMDILLDFFPVSDDTADDSLRAGRDMIYGFAGAGLTMSGVLIAADQSEGGLEITQACLAWITTMDNFLINKEVKASTEDYSVLVKIALDFLVDAGLFGLDIGVLIEG